MFSLFVSLLPSTLPMGWLREHMVMVFRVLLSLLVSLFVVVIVAMVVVLLAVSVGHVLT